LVETFPQTAPRPIPEVMASLAAQLTSDFKGSAVADVISGCFTNTWTTAMRPSEAVFDPSAPVSGEVFVVTGDIPAMWLRDSTAQIRPYVALATDPEIGAALVGVLRRQVSSVLLDPYANAFNDGPTGAHGEESDVPLPAAAVWERKYELDSLCAPLQLGYAIWSATGSTAHFDERFVRAARSIVALWRREQDHSQSAYTFRRERGHFTGDSLPRGGVGDPVGVIGMTWSGFRPSDDRCSYGYLTSSNALASSSLHGLAAIARDVLLDFELAAECLDLSADIDRAIATHAAHEQDGEQVYAYEIDGLGGFTLGDDANLPSLLSLPLSGWCNPADPTYLATRRFILSDANPNYYAGSHAHGVGSAHTPPDHIWPLAIATAGLTGTPAEAMRALEVLSRTTGGTGLMHESFHVDDDSVFTRSWFGWANSMFSELALDITGISVRQYFPVNPRAGALETVEG
jgi:uncharacterized protein